MSEIRVTTVSNTAGTGPVTLTAQYAAKAWWYYYQVTPTVIDSANVSSVTDTSTGLFEVVFNNDMADTNYGYSTSAGSSSATAADRTCWAKTVGSDKLAGQMGVAYTANAGLQDNYSSGDVKGALA